MLKTVEATGKTTDDAVAAALRSLMEINPDITEADVDVELLERLAPVFGNRQQQRQGARHL